LQHLLYFIPRETTRLDRSCDSMCSCSAGKFLSELMQTGTMNEAAICSQQLDRMYGPLRERVAQSLKRQDTVLRQLKVNAFPDLCVYMLYYTWCFIKKKPLIFDCNSRISLSIFIILAPMETGMNTAHHV